MGRRRGTLGHDFAHHWALDHPSLQSHRRPRVLVEAGDGAEAFARVRLLERHGYDAAWCPGPPEAMGSRCPLVAREQCPLTDWADVVVSSLGMGHPAGREVLEATRRTHPALPVVVEATRREADEWPGLLGGHRVVTGPVTAATLLGAIEEALGQPMAPPAEP